MPIDYSFEHTPNFRDLTQSGLVLLSRPLVRSVRQLRRLRLGAPAAAAPVPVKVASHFRRGPLSGSL